MPMTMPMTTPTPAAPTPAVCRTVRPSRDTLMHAVCLNCDRHGTLHITFGDDGAYDGFSFCSVACLVRWLASHDPGGDPSGIAALGYHHVDYLAGEGDARDHAFPRRIACGHALCYDDDGHTDGCVYDSDEYVVDAETIAENDAADDANDDADEDANEGLWL